jgi:CubicO group peptidase (beta-lactamase class C family)
VRRFVPELPVYSAPIRLRHLLRHTSGLRDYPALFALQGVDPSGPITEAQTLAMLSRQRSLNFTPGTEHLYNNSGYFLLALVVKRASGRPFAQFMRELLRPARHDANACRRRRFGEHPRAFAHVCAGGRRRLAHRRVRDADGGRRRHPHDDRGSPRVGCELLHGQSGRRASSRS